MGAVVYQCGRAKRPRSTLSLSLSFFFLPRLVSKEKENESKIEKHRNKYLVINFPPCYYLSFSLFPPAPIDSFCSATAVHKPRIISLIISRNISRREEGEVQVGRKKKKKKKKKKVPALIPLL